MKLDLDTSIKTTKDETFEELRKELNDVLNNAAITTYRNYDSRKFTFENENVIYNKERSLINDCIKDSDNPLYEVITIYSDKVMLAEYIGDVKNRNFIHVNVSDLMTNVKTGMFFVKNKDSYTFDKEVTEKISNEMEVFKNALYKEQLDNLSKMRKENTIYKIVHLEDDCADWRTELKNISTNEVFQELELPHDIYHQIGVDSLLKYENGKYKVLEGTTVYDLYPHSENYCEIEGKYITKNDSNILEKRNENIFIKMFNQIKDTIKNLLQSFNKNRNT